MPISQAPTFLQANPHILYGYRIDHSFLDAFWSFFRLHNETTNVHTHFWGFVIVALILYATFAAPTVFSPVVDFSKAPDVGYAVTLLLWFASALTCLGSSTLYHLFGCVSIRSYTRCTILDYFGITFLICASYYPSVYAAFACLPTWRLIYLTFITLPSVFVGVVNFVPATFSLGLNAQGPLHLSVMGPRLHIYRMRAYVALALAGVIPAIHFVIISPKQAPEMLFVLRMLIMYAMFGVGLLFYVKKWPEKQWPGKVTSLILSSHGIWHIAVAAAVVWSKYMFVDFFEWRWQQGCP